LSAFYEFCAKNERRSVWRRRGMGMIHFYRSSKKYGLKEILNERYDSSQVLTNMSSLLVFLKGIKKKEREVLGEEK
jgi:hypothetical protein